MRTLPSDRTTPSSEPDTSAALSPVVLGATLVGLGAGVALIVCCVLISCLVLHWKRKHHVLGSTPPQVPTVRYAGQTRHIYYGNGHNDFSSAAPPIHQESSLVMKAPPSYDDALQLPSSNVADAPPSYADCDVDCDCD